MQTDYVKILAQKTYQEKPVKTLHNFKRQKFHAMSFFMGVATSLLLYGYRCWKAAIV